MATTVKVRRARKMHRCDDYRCRGTGRIHPGERYERWVAFPWDDDVNQTPNLLVHKICAACSYGRIESDTVISMRDCHDFGQ